MQKTRRLVLKQANRRLPSSLTESFIADLNRLLDSDTTVQASYLKKFWLTKFVSLDRSEAEARRSAAITKWRGVEERNRITNRNLSSDEYLSSHALLGEPVLLGEVLDKAADVVRDVIGFSPSLDVAYAAYSGGASTSRRRAEGHPALKFLGRADSTRHAWLVSRDLFRGTRYADHIHAGLEPRMVRGSILFTVPKNSDIDRVACKEPDINVYLQKMFGSQIRYLLRRVGIDLNDQTINGDLARIGSLDESLATLDLSSASDSVTHALVKRLLPFDWYYWLNGVRSHQIEIDGAYHKLHMFSSMGNGFTFELESLIFYALARSVAYFLGIRGRISVYGDDIIVPVSLADNLIHVLSLVGFSVNVDKSFTEGPFRESCGSYWHLGENVKPFFLKGPMMRLTDLIKTLNSLVAWSSRTIGVVDPRYEDLHRKYRAFIPSDLHGGQDVTSITSLVTGDAPRMELRNVTLPKRMQHIGGFLHWLQTTALRTNGEVVSISGSSPSDLYRVKRNRSVKTDLPIFLGRYVDRVEVPSPL